MSYADDQDVWAQVCAEDTAAAAGAGDRAGATGSTTSPQETADSPADLPEHAEAAVDKPRAEAATPAGASGASKPSDSSEAKPRGEGLTGIPEVDQIAGEARRLIGSLSDRVQDLKRYQETRTPTPIEEAVRVLAPLRKRNPQVFDHLTKAVIELVRAYQAGVRNQEKKWANERARKREHIDLDD